MSRSLCFHVRTYNRCDWIKIFSPNRGSSKKSVSLGVCLIQQEELPLPIVQSFHSNFSHPLSVESWQAGCKPPKWSRAIIWRDHHHEDNLGLVRLLSHLFQEFVPFYVTQDEA